MAKLKQPKPVDATGTEVVEDVLPVVQDDEVEYEDVSGKDALPVGVSDPADDDEEDEPEAKPVKREVKSETKPAAKTEDDVPEELKGKTPAQLAKMYREAQGVIGRQGSELGELRRMADGYIKSNLRPQPKSEPKSEPVKQPDDVDFFTDPRKAVAALIENHPALKNLEGSTKAFAEREIIRSRQDAERVFNSEHPDAGAVLADTNFRTWVEKSPVRKALLLRAHQHYDLHAAREVFNTWKELQAARKPAEPETKPESKAKPVADKKAARMPTGGNASPKQEGKSEKIYRRADIIRLMTDDPDRYQMMAPELDKAYAEGRVR